MTFRDGTPELPPLQGVSVESAGPNGLRLSVSGDIGPLIVALAKHPISSLTSRAPSLEEIFLHHYDGSEPDERH